MKSFARKLKDLKDVIDIQGSHGNWNYDPYMMGLYNGLEMARSIITETEPVFKDAPKKWLKDISISNRIKLWWLMKTGKGMGKS